MIIFKFKIWTILVSSLARPLHWGRKISKLGFLELQLIISSQWHLLLKRMLMLWRTKRERGILPRLSLPNISTSHRLSRHHYRLCKLIKFKKQGRPKKKKWQLSSTKWGKTLSLNRELTLCRRVWCTDKRRWWTGRLMSSRRIRNKSETSSTTWSTKDQPGLKAHQM
mgnify:FL=1